MKFIFKCTFPYTEKQKQIRNIFRRYIILILPSIFIKFKTLLDLSSVHTLFISIQCIIFLSYNPHYNILSFSYRYVKYNHDLSFSTIRIRVTIIRQLHFNIMHNCSPLSCHYTCPVVSAGTEPHRLTDRV